MSLTWEGRQLVSFFPDDNGDYPFCYTYDDEGRRVQKSTEGQIYTNYVYEGDLLLYETGTYGTIVYIYDGGSTPIGMMYHASSETATWQFFWYEKNLQDDVVAVYSHDGVKLVSYVYDAWGNTTTTYHNGGSSTGAYYNPIRYRSYYYDREIELYYLGTRWYSPRSHRFMSPDNVDVTAATPGGLTDKNLYAYCDNNPVMRVDHTGEFWHVVIGTSVGALVGAATQILSNIILGEDQIFKDVGVAALSGAVSGLVSSLGAPLWAIVATDATLSAAESIYADVRDGKNIANVITNAVISASASALFSAIGGASNGKEMNQLFAKSKSAKQRLSREILHPSTKDVLRGDIKQYKKALKKFGISTLIEPSVLGFLSDGFSLGGTTVSNNVYGRFS